MQPCKSCRNHQKHAQNIGWAQELLGRSIPSTHSTKKRLTALWWWLPSPPTWTRFIWALLPAEGILPVALVVQPLGGKQRQPAALQPPSLNPVSAANTGSSIWFPICNSTYHSGSWQPCATSHLWVILHKATGISSREILHSVVSGSSSILWNV